MLKSCGTYVPRLHTVAALNHNGPQQLACTSSNMSKLHRVPENVKTVTGLLGILCVSDAGHNNVEYIMNAQHYLIT